ncbi:MAG: D-glucuronyl C5-epimerase family protein, partial [Solirubrobacteraceae bacterium]
MTRRALLAVAAIAPLIATSTAPARAGAHCARPPGGECHVLLILAGHGRTHMRAVPIAGPGTWQLPPVAALPTAAGRAVLPHARLARTANVPSALHALKGSGAISAADAQRYGAIYAAATRSLSHLSGTRQSELAAVLANVQSIAAGRQLNASRLPAVFMTLARNRQWWTTGPLLSDGAHLSFPGSRLVWEYYPGQGIEIQWLATFGEANGYYLSGHDNGALGQVLEEALELAASRAGGIAWEYLFHFDGGAPPWTSGLSQGTAIQALARAYQRLHDGALREAAESALGIFRSPPPGGVSVAHPGGDWYVQYTYNPRDLILNGFIQALVGLYDFTAITGSPIGQQLFEAGDAAARRAVPSYNTGSWSHYDQFTESTLSYHELLSEFLSHLCERTRHGEPLAQFQATTAPAGGGTGGAHASTSSGQHAGGKRAGGAPGAVARPAQNTAGGASSGAEATEAP